MTFFLFSVTATANFHKYVHSPVFCLFVLIIMIIKRISRAPIYRTRWEHRALYNNTNDRHRHAHTHASDEGIGTAVKNSLEIIIKQVCLVGGFKREGRIGACSHKANSWYIFRITTIILLAYCYIYLLFEAQSGWHRSHGNSAAKERNM